jgi:dTDP-4-dehydrorhamnose reductase
MKAVLLGPNGQLGSDIRRAAANVELISVSRAELDVASTAAIGDALGPLQFDALINCTSYHKTDEVEDNAGRAFEVNTHAVQAMARVCAAKKARFIHISTDYVFGGDTAPTTPLAEDAPVAPVNVYGASKAMGEQLARLACDDTVVLRVASLFGVAGASGKGGNFVETMLRLGREKGALRVVSDQVMSPTSTADIAGIVVRMLSGGADAGMYHVVNSGAVSWFEFASEIIKRAGVNAEVSPCTTAEFPTRAMRPRYSALDNSKIARAVAPMRPWQDALNQYLREKGHAP